MKSHRPLAFLGTPEVAAVVLRGLLSAGRRIDLVVTAPDKRRGRGGALAPTPVKTVALDARLPVSHDLEDVERVTGPDTLGIVVAYGRLIPGDLLDRVPMLNVHFSLLPRWRGAAPVERAILAGDEETGVCIMRMDEGLDTGNVLGVSRTTIAADDTTATLLDRLSQMSIPLLLGCLDSPDLTGVPQQGDSTYARKISRAEGDLDWSESSALLARRIRAFRCHTHLGAGRVSILGVEEVADQARLPADAVPGSVVDGPLVRTGDGWLRLLEVKPEGRASTTGADWFRGLRIASPVFIRGR